MSLLLWAFVVCSAHPSFRAICHVSRLSTGGRVQMGALIGAMTRKSNTCDRLNSKITTSALPFPLTAMSVSAPMEGRSSEQLCGQWSNAHSTPALATATFLLLSGHVVV